VFDSESFLFVAKEAGLSFEELSIMDLGQAMDFIVEFANKRSRSEEEQGQPKRKVAQQSDFDAF
jgi:hypothetical protein